MATFGILEQSSGTYRATVTDEAGNVLPASDLTSLTLTLYAISASGVSTYIRQNQDVLNINGVAVHNSIQTDALIDGTAVDYSLKWTITPADTTMVNANLTTEKHIALFQWTWDSGVKKGKHEVTLAVKNLREV